MAVDAPKFSHVGEGRVTAVLNVVISEASHIEADRFASGVTGFADRAQEPLQTYLRAITGSAGLAAAVSDARVENLALQGG